MLIVGESFIIQKLQFLVTKIVIYVELTIYGGGIKNIYTVPLKEIHVLLQRFVLYFDIKVMLLLIIV